jgi:hypothetical protein
MTEQYRCGRHPDCPSKKAPLVRAGPSIWDGTSDDYTEHLALAAVSAASVASTAAGMSAAKLSATVRTAEASMRRESARLTAAAAAETTSARRA